MTTRDLQSGEFTGRHFDRLRAHDRKDMVGLGLSVHLLVHASVSPPTPTLQRPDKPRLRRDHASLHLGVANAGGPVEIQRPVVIRLRILHNVVLNTIHIFHVRDLDRFRPLQRPARPTVRPSVARPPNGSGIDAQRRQAWPCRRCHRSRRVNFAAAQERAAGGHNHGRDYQEKPPEQHATASLARHSRRSSRPPR